MARIQCRTCDHDERVRDWDGALRCPRCGSRDVRVAMAVEEIPAEDWERMLDALGEPEDGDIPADD